MHTLLGGQLPVLPRAWGPDNTGTSLDGRKREALGTLTEFKIYARGLGNCADVGSSLGGTGPPEKTLWACCRGRKTGTGTGRAEERKPHGQWLFSTPHLSTPLLVTRRKATLLLIRFQESSLGETAMCPQSGLS